MISFQLNGVNVNVEVAPKIIETLDESLDSASVVLEANTNENPVEPMTPFTITKDNETILMYVASDNVEVFSTSPLRFKHTLSLIQSSRRLNKLLVRNSVFSQPAQKVKKAFWSIGQYRTLSRYPDEDEEYIELAPLPGMCVQGMAETSLSLTSREKIKGIPYIIITYTAGFFDIEDATAYADLTITEVVENESLDVLNSKSTNQKYDIVFGEYNEDNEQYIVAYIYYVDSNNQSQNTPIYLTDIVGGKIEFNQPLYIPKIKTILENGGKSLYVSTQKFDGCVRNYIDSGNDIVDYEWNTYHCAFKSLVNGESQELRIMLTATGHQLVFINTQINLYVETYYYTTYDILDLLNKRQVQKNSLGQKNLLTYTLNPSSTTGQLLQKTIAPNFSFTQCTMHECLAEVFRLFDATFKLKIDGELEIEYLNTSETASTIANTDFSGETRSISDDRYNTGLISYYQDARVKETFPLNNNFIKATSAELGVPTDRDHIFLLPHNIDNIISAKGRIRRCRIPYQFASSHHSAQSTAFLCDFNITVDITPYVLENSIWSVADSSATFPLNNDYKEVTQVNSVVYNKGGNQIDIGYSYKNGWLQWEYAAFNNMLYSAYCRSASIIANSPEPHPELGGVDWGTPGRVFSFKIEVPSLKDWQYCFAQFEYETTVDGRVRNESILTKYNGEMLIDQYNGAVDLNKMGLNMMGLSLKLGEPTLNANHKITSWANRVRKGMVYIDNDGKKWVANVCSYTFLDEDTILGEISFTANYNALSLRTKLNRERRMTNISSELITKSEDNYVEYIYFSQGSHNVTQENLALNVTTTMIGSFFPSEYTPLSTTEIPEVAILDKGILTKIYIPMIKYSSGNSLCFEMSYNHPMAAGQRTLLRSGWFGNEQFTQVANYADSDGFSDIIGIRLLNHSSVTTTNNFPYITYNLLDDPVVELDDYEMYKQPNEIMALNYQLVFLPIESERNNIFLGRAFYDNNFLINDKVGTHKFYIHYGYGKYDILDTEIIDGENPSTEILEVDNIFVTNANEVVFFHTGTNPPANATCWCLTDEDNQIYIMCNTVQNQASQTIRFYKRRNRLKL